jgi:hypothetical protein
MFRPVPSFSWSCTLLLLPLSIPSSLAGPSTHPAKPKAGQWQLEAQNPMGGALKHSTCVDANFDWSRAVPQQSAHQCTTRNLKQSPNQVSFDLDCTLGKEAGGLSLSSNTIITGNLETAYTFTVSTAMKLPGLPEGMDAAALSQRMTVTGSARWVGPCKK